jgi:hypothetical protein
VYEVTGPFRARPPGDPPPDDPPPDEPPPDDPPPPPDTVSPRFRLIAPRRVELSDFIRRGFNAWVEANEAATISAVLTAELVDRRPGASKEPRTHRLAAVTKRTDRPREVRLHLNPSDRVRRRLRGRPSVLATRSVDVTDEAGNRSSRSRPVRLT